MDIDYNTIQALDILPKEVESKVEIRNNFLNKFVENLLICDPIIQFLCCFLLKLTQTFRKVPDKTNHSTR